MIGQDLLLSSLMRVRTSTTPTWWAKKPLEKRKVGFLVSND